MKITISVDKRVVANAREAARKMGKTLNQTIREYLQQLADTTRLNQDFDAFEQRCLSSKGGLNGWKFNRDEANQR